MIKQILVVGLVGAGLVLGSGCSSSDGGAAPVSLEKLPQTYADALCNAIAPCCKADAIPFTATTCKSKVTDTLTNFVAQSTGSKYDAQAAGTCLSQIKAALDSCKAFDENDADNACGTIFTGDRPLGAPCAVSNDCASRACRYDGGLESVCVDATDTGSFDPAHAKLGEACLGDCYQVDGDSQCSGAVNIDAVAYCFESDSLYCSFETGACVARAAVGESCRSTGCVTGSFCDPDGAVCAKPRDSGACYYGSSSSDTGCSDKSYCTGVVTGGAGQCVTRKPDGYSCTVSEECASHRCNSADTCGVGPAATQNSCSGDLL